MTIEIGQLLKTFEDQIEKIPERYPGYRGDLYEYAARIITYEREHSYSKTDIVNRISDQAEALAVLIDQQERKKT